MLRDFFDHRRGCVLSPDKIQAGLRVNGGIVGVRGYGGGVIGRYSDLPEEFPAIAEFHTFRVNMPAGKKCDHLQLGSGRLAQEW